MQTEITARSKAGKRRQLKRERACNYRLAALAVVTSFGISISMLASVSITFGSIQNPPPPNMVAMVQSELYSTETEVTKETIKPDPTIKFAEKRANLDAEAEQKRIEAERLAAEAAEAAAAQERADKQAAEAAAAAKAKVEAEQNAAKQQENNLAAEGNLTHIGQFRATWYSVPGAKGAAGWVLNGNHVAMNDAQFRSLGLSYGDKIVVEFGRTGEKKTYIIADSGCAWGTVDIFVPSRNQIPSYGVDQVQVYKVG